MRVIDLHQIPRMDIDQYGSHGFHWGWLTREGHVSLSMARLEPGGRIGRHPAVGDHLLVVISGEVDTAGADGVPTHLDTGNAALFAHAEEHDTTARSEGALLLIVEGAFKTWPESAQIPRAKAGVPRS